LKYHKRATFIGEETGGTYECNDAHTLFNTKETRLNLNVARMTFTTATDGLSREHGIIPDYYVEPKIKDIIDGKDTVKEFTYGLIKKNK
jgi:C-terminal processing protease CtpA/Prc